MSVGKRLLHSCGCSDRGDGRFVLPDDRLNRRGYRFAEAAGHKVTELSPALVPFETKEDVKELQGLSLRNVEAADFKWKERGLP